MASRAPLRRVIAALPAPLRRQRLLSALAGLRLVSPRQRLHYNGSARAWIDLRDAESRAYYLSETFWPAFPPMIAAFLRGGGDLFDVGANFGLVTFGTVPFVAGLGVSFHLFEANARIFPCLERSAREWPGERFIMNHVSVSDRAGASGFSLPDAEWGHGFVTDQGSGAGAVSNVRLDDYIREQRVERIGFLKIDIEGSETRAVAGARRALEAGVVQAGLIEVIPATLARAGSSTTELVALLMATGFDLYFTSMLTRPDVAEIHGRRWTEVPLAGTPLWLAPALPVPDSFETGDMLMLHRSTAFASEARAAVGRR